MNEENYFKATSHLSRMLESGHLVLRLGWSIKVDSEVKNKETRASLFFTRFQRSKVIARVTRNSPLALSGSSCAYLALRGCDPTSCARWLQPVRSPHCRQIPLPMVAEQSAVEKAFAPSPGGRFRFGFLGAEHLELFNPSI